MLANFTPYTAEHTYAGVGLKVRIADTLAQGWYDHDWGPLPEIDLLRQGALHPGARVLDLGAHQGVVAMILAHHVGPSGQVVAVEALPHNARMAEVNRDLNGFGQIRVEAAAVSDQPGELEISTGLNGQVRNAATDIGTTRVPAVTVDGLAERHGPPGVLFIDVEGYECHALRGAARTLEPAQLLRRGTSRLWSGACRWFGRGCLPSAPRLGVRIPGLDGGPPDAGLRGGAGGLPAGPILLGRSAAGTVCEGRMVGWYFAGI